jgi:hypothetical protein
LSKSCLQHAAADIAGEAAALPILHTIT